MLCIIVGEEPGVGAQRIDFFPQSGDEEGQLLFVKSRYMAPDQKGYDRQKAFDDALAKLNLFDFSGFGPASDAFISTLSRAGLVIRDFDLQSATL
jgi:hypothetical protein